MRWEGWHTIQVLIIGAAFTGLYRWIWKHSKGKWWGS